MYLKFEVSQYNALLKGLIMRYSLLTHFQIYKHSILKQLYRLTD